MTEIWFSFIQRYISGNGGISSTIILAYLPPYNYTFGKRQQPSSIIAATST